jgi:hypothetical protein
VRPRFLVFNPVFEVVGPSRFKVAGPETIGGQPKMFCPKDVRMLWKIHPTWMAAGVAMLALLNLGCGKSDGVNTAMDQQMKELNVQKQSVAKFAGHVTIDGKSPREAYPKQVLVVMLYDPKNPKGGGPLHTICRNDGEFEFSTYERGDGVPPGSYVVLFAELNHPLMGSKRAKRLKGPDSLMNLYNDPDKNAENPRFKIDLAEPGKTDEGFDLEVQGKQPIGTPGPHAVTELD